MRAFVLAIVCLIVLPVTTGCDSDSPEAGLPSTPTATRAGISREQYEQARAKWRAQGVEEYEARVEYSAYSEFMGIWTLHVRVSVDDAQVLGYTREPGLDAPLGFVGS